jgi:hypothetical protein
MEFLAALARHRKFRLVPENHIEQPQLLWFIEPKLLATHLFSRPKTDHAMKPPVA